MAGDLSKLSDEELRAIMSQGNTQETPPATPPSEDPGLGANMARSAARGVVSTLGFPAEAALAVPKLGAFATGDEGAQAFLSSVDPTQAINWVFNQAGIRTDPHPQGFAENLASNAAEAVAGGATGIGAASRASGVIRAGTEKLMAGHLGRFAAEDAAAATVGATAHTIADQAGFGDKLAMGTELGASMLTGGFLNRVRVAKEAFQAAGSIPGKFRENERAAASRFWQNQVTEAGRESCGVANALKQDPKNPIDGSPGGFDHLTSGARSGSPALTSAENAVIKGDKALQDKFMASKLSLKDFMDDELRKALGGDGVSQDFLDHYRQSADWAMQVTEKNRQTAIQKAWDEIKDLPPGDADYSTPIKRQLEEAKRSDREIERELWDKTGADSLLVESSDPSKPFIKEAWDALKKEIAQSGRGINPNGLPNKDIMGQVREIAGDVKSEQPDAISAYFNANKPAAEPHEATATVKEMLALRGTLLDAAAEASASQNASLARRLNALADGALNTLDGASGESAEAIQQARQFSKGLNDRYSRDVISPLLAQSASRGELIPGNETMERLFKPGESGRTNFRALNLASGGIPNEASQYVLQQFYKNVVGEEGIDVKSAESFIQKYQPALEEAGLMDTVSSYVVTGKAVNKANVELAALASDQAKDVAAGVLKRYGQTGDDLTNFIGSTLKGEASGAQGKLKEMYDTALTDLSGNALRGLKSATVDGALKAFYTAGGDTSARLPDILARTTHALEATGQFTPEQIERVNQLGTIAHKQASAERLRSFKGQSNTPQDLASVSIISNLMKLASLKYVAPLVSSGGPGSLREASMVSKWAGKLAGFITKNDAASLIRGAVFDKDLMAALLENPNTVSPKSVGMIKGFLKGVGRFVVGGALRPSQTTIVNDVENQDGR